MLRLLLVCNPCHNCTHSYQEYFYTLVDYILWIDIHPHLKNKTTHFKSRKKAQCVLQHGKIHNKYQTALHVKNIKSLTYTSWECSKPLTSTTT